MVCGNFFLASFCHHILFGTCAKYVFVLLFHLLHTHIYNTEAGRRSRRRGAGRLKIQMSHDAIEKRSTQVPVYAINQNDENVIQ